MTLLPPTPDAAAPTRPDRWTRDHLGLCLVEAFRTLDRLPRAHGPRAAGNHWPRHTLEPDDLLGLDELPEDERRTRAAARHRPRPSGRDIDAMDRAFDWLRELYAADPDLARVVSQWALCAARRRSVRALCRSRDWTPQTFYATRARALDLLAATLNARGVAVF